MATEYKPGLEEQYRDAVAQTEKDLGYYMVTMSGQRVILTDSKEKRTRPNKPLWSV